MLINQEIEDSIAMEKGTSFLDRPGCKEQRQVMRQPKSAANLTRNGGAAAITTVTSLRINTNQRKSAPTNAQNYGIHIGLKG